MPFSSDQLRLSSENLNNDTDDGFKDDAFLNLDHSNNNDDDAQSRSSKGILLVVWI